MATMTTAENVQKQRGVIRQRVSFGLIVASRGFFNPQLAANGRAELLQRLEKLGYGYQIMPVEATPNGAVETLSDARKYAEFFQVHRKEIDGLLVVLPNFGDEIGVAETISRAGLNVPVLVQALDDDLTKLGLKDRRDAFCGKLSVCNNLYQYGIPFTNTSRHTSSIASETFERDLDYFARVCRTVKGLRNARVGQVGTRPAPFQTVRFSEKLLQKAGITVVPVDMADMIARASKLDSDAPEVVAKLASIRAYGHIPSDIKEDAIVRQATLSVALEQWMDETECDASAIQCWDSIQTNFGCATCLSMSMMGERLVPSACETDITGAVSMYALLLASGNPPGFQDWNNNYGDDPDKCINVHCSNYPKSFMGKDLEISNLDVLGASIGYDRCFGAVKGQVVPGPMTFFRMSTFDSEGRIKAYVGEGNFTNDPCTIQGGSSVCHVPGLQSLMDYLCKHGFEHHVALVRGRWSSVVEEALTTYLGWELHVHRGETTSQTLSRNDV